MKWLPWRREGTRRIKEAQQALVASDLENLQAEKTLADSLRARISLAEIRRSNHFTQSIFPEGR